jgi:hypothetical protein
MKVLIVLNLHKFKHNSAQSSNIHEYQTRLLREGIHKYHFDLKEDGI